MREGNIRELKQDLRARCRRFRSRLDPAKKAAMDKEILARITDLPEFDSAPILFTYVSIAREVDTGSLILRALAGRRRVAVPRCCPETLGMRFYRIQSADDLKPGSYGVREPDPSRCEPAGNGSADTVCVVPGLSFDFGGYRLGYGKGYYDRFLLRFGGITVGLCYSDCVKRELPHGRYDRPVDILVTERYVWRVKSGNPED